MYSDDLLPEEKTLLDDNFEKNGATDASNQVYGVAEMDVSHKAAVYEHYCTQSCHMCQYAPPADSAQTNTNIDEDPIVDTEGSI